MNYAGFAVTHTCCGYLCLFACTCFAGAHLATLSVLGAASSLAALAVLVTLPVLASMLLVRALGRCASAAAARCCFLQAPRRSLALKNVRAYGVFVYFKFFYDCLAGAASCVARVAKSAALAVLCMPRLDRSFMGGSGLGERMDAAFMSYVGFALWEAHHTNAVAIAFCELLLLEQRLTWRRRDDQDQDEEDEEEDSSMSQDKNGGARKRREDEVWRRRRRARNRWHLVLVLVRNPCLRGMRRQTRRAADAFVENNSGHVFL